MELKKIKLNNIEIYTADQLDGYGLQHVSDFISVCKHFYKDRKFKNALEWCSGPGYFGFMLFDYDLAEKVTLTDIFEPLHEVVNETIAINQLEDKVKFMVSDNFANVDEKFDLIVGNPPHFNFELEYNEETIRCHEHRKFMDRHWKIHDNFFRHVSNYLTDDGEIVLMENCKGSVPDTFKQMIEENNLQIKDIQKSQEFPNDVYFIRIKKDNDIKKH